MENNSWKEIIKDILITIGITILILALSVIAVNYLASGDARLQ